MLTTGEFSCHAGLAFGAAHRHFPDQASLADALLEDLSEEDSVLVKGSRSAHMEAVVERLRATEAVC